MRGRAILGLTTLAAAVATIALSYVLLPKTYVQVRVGESILSVPIPYNVLGVTLTAIAIAIELLPLAITEYRLWRINNEVFTEIPTVIRVLRDGLGSGQSLGSIAGMLTSVGRGRLGRILAEAITKEGMGMTTIKEELTRRSRELGNEYLAVLAVILDTAIKSGARLQETLDMAYRSFEDAVSYYRDKANQVRPYLALIYTVMAVYVILAGVVIYLMVPSMGRITINASTGAIATPTIATIDVPLFSSIIVMSAVAQSMIAGLIIGRMVYGRAFVGLLHSSILIITVALMNYAMYAIMYLHIM